MKIVPMYPAPIKLKIKLEHTDIYRQVLVSSGINMLQLHLVIQQAMGWMMIHLFEFTDKKVNGSIRAGLPIPEDDMGFFSGAKEIGADTVKLRDFEEITARKPFWYCYDFGDDWWHKVSFQKVTKKDLEIFNAEPICVKGEKACPPEDIGGVGGYFHFLEIMGDKKHPERAEMMEWYEIEGKENFDEDTFDIDEANGSLFEVYHSKFWNQTANNFMAE